MNVTACLVTRGDVALGDIIESLPEEWPKIIWDNSVEHADLAVYGRYAAINKATTKYVYVQDDDCVLDRAAIRLLAVNALPDTIVANMPEHFRDYYWDSCLIGFGAIFERDLPNRVFAKMPARPLGFNRTCDVYFTALCSRVLLDLPYRDQPWAHAADRMWKQPGHVTERHAALDQARKWRSDS